MSEQSGPITREQVERLIDDAQKRVGGPLNILGRHWNTMLPAYVLDAWHADEGGEVTLYCAALTRWRDELAAAEPVRRVARWDAERQRYMLTPPSTSSHQYNPSTADREQAIAWGYEIEGGPEPVRDWKSDRAIAAIWPTPKPAEDSPERLRERREALGWTLDDACSAARIAFRCEVERLERESDDSRCRLDAQDRVLYAAALSAEEARRAEEERLACAYRESDGTLVWDDSPLPEPERPAPRFKVGDWVRWRGPSWQIAEVKWNHGGWWVYTNADGFGGSEHTLEPASPPAPEVVDVPQPRVVVKRCDEVEAEWTSADATILIVTHDALDDAIFVPIALLRAMLEAIDAQQGGAS